MITSTVVNYICGGIIAAPGTSKTRRRNALVTAIVCDLGLELAGKAELFDGKKLVNWEFVERDTRFGTEGWKDVPLPAPVTPLTGRAGI